MPSKSTTGGAPSRSHSRSRLALRRGPGRSFRGARRDVVARRAARVPVPREQPVCAVEGRRGALDVGLVRDDRDRRGVEQRFRSCRAVRRTRPAAGRCRRTRPTQTTTKPPPFADAMNGWLSRRSWRWGCPCRRGPCRRSRRARRRWQDGCRAGRTRPRSSPCRHLATRPTENSDRPRRASGDAACRSPARR